MNYTEEQLLKLPKWAQQEIKCLTQNLEYAKKQIAMYNGTEETNTYIREGMDRKPLPKSASVEFKIGERQENTTTVRIVNNKTIDVNTDSRSGGTLVIKPRSANSFYIEFTN